MEWDLNTMAYVVGAVQKLLKSFAICSCDFIVELEKIYFFVLTNSYLCEWWKASYTYTVGLGRDKGTFQWCSTERSMRDGVCVRDSAPFGVWLHLLVSSISFQAVWRRGGEGDGGP